MSMIEEKRIEEVVELVAKDELVELGEVTTETRGGGFGFISDGGYGVRQG